MTPVVEPAALADIAVDPPVVETGTKDAQAVGPATVDLALAAPCPTSLTVRIVAPLPVPGGPY